MKKLRSLLSFLLAACLLLGLTACEGTEKEAEETSTGGTLYISESVPFASPLSELESVCLSGDSLYLLGVIYDDSSGHRANSSSGNMFSLVRVPVDGGKAETLDAFQSARLPLEGDTRQSSNSGCLHPGADGTLWLTEEVSYWCYDLPEDFDPEKDEKYQYVSDRGSSMFLRQLDGEGNELVSFEFPDLDDALGADVIYDLWTDGAGTFFANTGDAVVLLNEDGTVRATMEGESMEWNRFISLGDGRTAILGTVRSVDGAETRLRVIDTQAGAWAEDGFTLPFDAACVQGGDGADTLFYYKRGDALYAWRQGAEEPERVMSWSESGMDANNLAVFAFLPDGRLAAASYSGYSFDRSVKLSLLTSTEAGSAPERTVLTLAAYYLDPPIKAEIAEFNRTSSTCYISATEYLALSSDVTTENTEAEFDQAALRMVTDLTVGKVPDIIYLNRAMPVRRMEAQGILENLWPYIEADPDLGRDALMTRPLEAVEYNGGLYRIGSYFVIDTVLGRKDVVGDRLTWTYEDLWDVYETMPEGSAVTHTSDYKHGMLERLVEIGVDRFVDWDNCVSFFDGEEFRALLEFCNRFPDERDPAFPPGNLRVASTFEDWLAVGYGEQMLVDSGVGNFLNLGQWKSWFSGDAAYVGWPNEAGQVGSVFDLAGGTTLAITASSEHKEEAWSFLRRQLLPSEELTLMGEEDDYWQIRPFPINRSDFERLAEQAMTPKMEEKDGVLQEVPWMDQHWKLEDVEFDVTVYAMTQEEYDQIMELYNAVEATGDYDVNLMNIITEQAGAYFAGDKSLDDTVSAIQSRAGLYLAELQ